MNRGITHEQFVNRVFSHAKIGTTESACSAIVQSALEVIAFELLSTGAINLKGVGRLIRSTRPAHQAHNPRTGAAVSVPSKRRVRFKQSKALVL